MQAVILAGGLGTRLRPITHKIPKHLVAVGSKPFLEHLIAMLKKRGINEIVLCVGHLWQQIKDYFGDGKKFGITIKYSIEKKLMGTGGAIKKAEKYLKENFFVVYGDSFLELDYGKLMRFHQKMNKIGTLVVYGNKNQTLVKNNIELSKNNYVADYNKNMQSKKMDYVDAGVLVFKKSVLKMIPPNMNISLEEEIFPKLIKRREFVAFKSDKRFYDIGTMQRLKIFRKVFE